MKQSGFTAALAAATLCAFAAAQANAQSSPPQPTTPQSGKAAILILDASGSMWGQLGGGITKIEVAREVMGQFFATRDASIPLGVIAYGHNRRGDCSDIEIIARAGQQDAGALSQRLNRINPRGMTPISESLRIAAGQIPPTAEEADIILVTDGLETCNADPCAVAAQLANEGIKIRAHVVGFGLSEQQANALACVPDQTGGRLLRPQSGAELTDALNQIAAAEPMPEPEAEPGTSTMFRTRFVFRDTGTGTPRGLMEWTATAPDGTVIPLGTTEGHQQSLEGRSAQLPGGEWTIVAEGPEGRAELTLTLSRNGDSHGVPFTGAQFAAEIPPLGQVQAGMAARIPFEITHAGSGHLGGTPYKIIATGPDGSLTRDQIVREDLISSREPGTYGGATGTLEPGTYRLLVVIARQNRVYEIIAERGFESVENPVVNIVGPDRARPGEAVSLSFDGGYATNYSFYVVDNDDRNLIQGRALYHGPGGGAGGPLSLDVRMPDQEGTFDIVVRRNGGRDAEIIARKPITLGDAPALTQAAPGQDALPMVRATFRLPDGFPPTPLWWSAVPLDPDMSPEAWAPQSEMVVGEAEFEPGRYEVSAMGPGETEFRGVVEIVPGQPNDFVIPLVGGGEAEQNPPGQRGDAGPVEGEPRMAVTLLLPDQVEGKVVQWSAIRLDKVMQDVEFAMNDYMGSYTADLAPGRYRIDGAGQGFDLEGEITVTSGGQSRFVIPLTSGERAQESQGMACRAPSGCAYHDPVTGLALILPQGWEIDAPFFYETAGGAKAGQPSASLSRTVGSELQQIMLNPRQWMASSGPCTGTPAGELCRATSTDGAYLGAFEVVRSSLRIATARAAPAPAAAALPSSNKRSNSVGLTEVMPRQ
ncbi:VWA domain-containing protein [Stappia sp. TSB10GB4]|uniref:vWA domain-containing protein n=1 Tax=Stappia sp. TSB10GB4 TaxID=2003584 RepID=UPI00210F593C|nr:VWA domain-containing protein [Stappia sp. TSB10GB4]